MKDLCNMIHLKNLLDEDFTNYKKASLFLGFPSCSFKCEKESGRKMCQNASLIDTKTIAVSIKTIFERYSRNVLTQAIVCGGLEPFDSFDELYALIKYFREQGDKSDFVIYTGYYPEEIFDKLAKITGFGNTVVKFGRFKPDEEAHLDEVLGVKLMSDNQFAVEYK